MKYTQSTSCGMSNLSVHANQVFDGNSSSIKCARCLDQAIKWLASVLYRRMQLPVNDTRINLRVDMPISLTRIIHKVKPTLAYKKEQSGELSHALQQRASTWATRAMKTLIKRPELMVSLPKLTWKMDPVAYLQQQQLWIFLQPPNLHEARARARES